MSATTLPTLALLAALALAPLRAAAGGDPAGGDRWPEPPSRGGEGWSQADREGFVEFCRPLAPEPFCRCWLEALEPQYRSLGAYLKEVARRATRDPGPEARGCWRRHGYGP